MICEYCHTSVGVPGHPVHRLCDKEYSRFVLTAWAPCGMCGKEWPHPGVLSSAPTCDHCVQDLKKNLIELQRSIQNIEKQEDKKRRAHFKDHEQERYRRLESPLTDFNPAPWWSTTTPKIKPVDLGLSASDSILRRLADG